jgi:hypothetical protein
MRGTQAKLKRLKAQASPNQLRALSNVDHRKLYVSHDQFFRGGKRENRDHSVTCTKPNGTWKSFWSCWIGNISKQNRLPRGFKKPNPYRRARPGEMETTPVAQEGYFFK